MSHLLDTSFPVAPLRRFVLELTDGPFGSSLTSSHYSEDGARVIRLGNIGSAEFRNNDEAYIPLDYFNSLRRHEVVPGDLIIAGLGDQNHPVGRACVAPKGLGPAIVKADCFRARLDESRLLHRYSAWALSSSAISQQILTLTRGTTRARINLDLVRDIELPIPSVEEQGRIADFLNAETARIDKLTAMRERQVSLLRERLMATWAQVINDDARDSAWSPIRRFITAITDGPFGSALTSNHYSDDGARVIRLGNLGRAEFRERDPAYISLKYFSELRRHEALPGDLIVAGLGDQNHPLGRACVVPKDLGPAMVKADCFRLRLNQRRILHEYAAWALSSPPVTDQVTLLARGSTRARINLEVARDIPLPVPSIERQRRSIAVLGEMRFAMNDIISQCRRQVTLLTERRQALITATVTGQFDVTTASGRNVTEGVSA
ncbi:restriction endonuclease subunit S [Streptomyces sp. F-7]|uniref:restriction endonuclease subunit S n=1 Tax=Streptomyces sp. F-7 TaxID=573566 RepID=UPI000A584A76|nr:restriction endonuclease subunit S [Streptomyces sp. F-7]